MTPDNRQEAVRDAVRSLPGLDEGERHWVQCKALAWLSQQPPGTDTIPVSQLVRQWAGVFARMERPILDGEMDAAIDAAIRLHGGLTREVELLCRYLIHQTAASGAVEFTTVGDLSDFILFALIALEDGSTDLSTLHDIADQRADRIAMVLKLRGEPALSAGERVWLHREILSGFADPAFTPFQENPTAGSAQVDQLVHCLQHRRGG